MTPKAYRIILLRAISALLEVLANPTAKTKAEAHETAQSLNFFADQMSEDVITEAEAERNFNHIQPIKVRKKAA